MLDRTERVEMGDDVKLDEGMVSDNRDASRFELTVEGHTGVLVYKRTPASLVLVHTEVPPAIRGRRFGEALVKGAIDAAHAEGLRIVAVCPFVKAYLRKHPDQS